MNCPSKLSLAFLSGILKLYYLVFSDLSWKRAFNPKHCGGNKSGKLQVKCIIEYLSGKTQTGHFFTRVSFPSHKVVKTWCLKKATNPPNTRQTPSLRSLRTFPVLHQRYHPRPPNTQKPRRRLITSKTHYHVSPSDEPQPSFYLLPLRGPDTCETMAMVCA